MGKVNDSSLGQYLRTLRDARGLSLRAVEDRTDISNAFLSQLESGKVKKPSPLMLYKLGEVYGVPYETLMERAGHPVPEVAGQSVRSTATVFDRFGKITREEEQELLDYLGFLRSRNRRDGGRKG